MKSRILTSELASWEHREGAYDLPGQTDTPTHLCTNGTQPHACAQWVLRRQASLLYLSMMKARGVESSVCAFLLSAPTDKQSTSTAPSPSPWFLKLPHHSDHHPLQALGSDKCKSLKPFFEGQAWGWHVATSSRVCLSPRFFQGTRVDETQLNLTLQLFSVYHRFWQIKWHYFLKANVCFLILKAIKFFLLDQYLKKVKSKCNEKNKDDQ